VVAVGSICSYIRERRTKLARIIYCSRQRNEKHDNDGVRKRRCDDDGEGEGEEEKEGE
jgi:hypothetical protein